MDGMHAGQRQGDWSHVRRCQRTFRVKGDTLITPPSKCAALGRVELKLDGLPGKTITRDATRSHQFVVHAAGWLHSIMLHGCWCCTIPLS